MNYEASEWVSGDVALVTGANGEPTLRMLIVRRTGDYLGRRLWWGQMGGEMGYFREDSIRNIERVTMLTNEELNQRVEVNP